jgi:hypothetical protein
MTSGGVTGSSTEVAVKGGADAGVRRRKAATSNSSSCLPSETGSDEGLRLIGSVFDRVLHAETFTLDDDGLDMVEDAIEDGRREGTVIVEDLWPVLVRPIGSEDRWYPLVALADDLEHEVCAKLVDREVPELVDVEDRRIDVAADVTLEPPGGLGGRQRIDDIDRRREQHRVPGETGGAPQGDRQMRLAEAARSRDILPGIKASAESITRFIHDAVKHSLLFDVIVFKA